MAIVKKYHIQGYGQTECCGACTVTHYSDHSTGHVGGVLNTCQIKLVSVEEMGYLASENRGEVCIKGVNVFKGYYKNEVISSLVFENFN